MTPKPILTRSSSNADPSDPNIYGLFAAEPALEGSVLLEYQLPAADYLPMDSEQVGRHLAERPFARHMEVSSINGFRGVLLLSSGSAARGVPKAVEFSATAMFRVPFPSQGDCVVVPDHFPFGNETILAEHEVRDLAGVPVEVVYASDHALRAWTSATVDSSLGRRFRENLFGLLARFVFSKIQDETMAKTGLPSMHARAHFLEQWRSAVFTGSPRDGLARTEGLAAHLRRAWSKRRGENRETVLRQLRADPRVETLERVPTSEAEAQWRELRDSSTGRRLRLFSISKASEWMQHSIRSRPGVALDLVTQQRGAGVCEQRDARWWSAFRLEEYFEAEPDDDVDDVDWADWDYVPFVTFDQGRALPETVPWEVALRFLFLMAGARRSLQLCQGECAVRPDRLEDFPLRQTLLVPRRFAEWFVRFVKVPAGGVRRYDALARFVVMCANRGRPLASALESQGSRISAPTAESFGLCLPALTVRSPPSFG